MRTLGSLIRFFLRIVPWIAIVSVFSLILVLATSEISDPDTMTYLAMGRYTVENGLLRGCVFTYTQTECHVNYNEWLFFVIVFLIYRLGSWNGLVAFQIFIIISTFVFAYLYNQQSKISTQAVLPILLLASLVGSERFMLRADTFSLLLLALFLYIVKRLVRSDFFPQERKKRALYILTVFIIQVLWVNTHGSFPMGFIVVAGFLIPGLIRAVGKTITGAQNRLIVDRTTKYLSLVFLTVLLASFMNPYGLKAFLFPFGIMISGAGKHLIQSIGEYKSPFAPSDFLRWTLNSYSLLLALCAVLLVLNLRRIQASDIFLLTPFFLASSQAVRYMAAFAVVAACILPQYLENAAHVLQQHIFTKTWAKKITRMVSIILYVGLIIISFIWGKRVVTNELYMTYGASRRFGLGLSAISYPIGAAQFIKEHSISGNIFNSYGFGGYLNFTLYPQYKTFIHGHMIDFGIVQSVWLYDYYLQVSRGEIDLSELTQKYGVTIFIIDTSRETSIQLMQKLYRDRNWRLVYADFNSLVFWANTQENAKRIPDQVPILQDIDSLLPLTLRRDGHTLDLAIAYNMAGVLLSRLDMPQPAISAYRKSLEFYPDDAIVYSNLGATYAQSRNYDQALAAYERAISLNTSHAAYRYNYGRALAEAGKLEEAVAEMKAALLINPAKPQVYEHIAQLLTALGDRRGADEYMRKALSAAGNPVIYFEAF